MLSITLTAAIGVVLLQASGLIPSGSVGGSMVIGRAYLTAAIALGVNEAWTNKRSVPGWIVNIIVPLFGTLIAAALVGDFLGALLSDGSQSLAGGGGIRFSLALAGSMLVNLLAAWGLLRLLSLPR